MNNKKNEIIQLSFKNNSMEEQLLLQWIKDNAVMMGKSTFIKTILGIIPEISGSVEISKNVIICRVILFRSLLNLFRHLFHLRSVTIPVLRPRER